MIGVEPRGASLPAPAVEVIEDSADDFGFVANGNPLSIGIPKASRDKAVCVGVRLSERAKGLRDTNDARSSVFVASGLAHELLDGLVGESCEIGEQLAVC